MGRFLRRLRGIFSTGLLWAVGWAGVTIATGLVSGIPFRFVGFLALEGVVKGFIAGGAFAGILSIAEGHRTLQDLSLKRVALWGAIGGNLLLLLAMPVLLSLGAPMVSTLTGVITNGLLGAGFASGSVALARRGEERLLEWDDPEPPRLDGG